MSFDPQKLFIGLMDFFSILLPGALLTYLLMGEVGPALLGDRYAALTGAQAWAAFLFASYLFGHLIFLLGSWLDELYDWAQRYTLNTQIARLARRSRLLSCSASSADSKFFRCFTVVLLILLVAWPWQDQWPPAGIPVVLALLLLALWRYMEQRYKATNQAYWSVITLAAKDGKFPLDKTVSSVVNHNYSG